MAPHSQPQIRMEQYQVAVVEMARIISVLGWEVPEESDTSLQALAVRAGKIKTFLSQAGGEKVRSVAGDRRRALGDLVHDLDMDAADVPADHPLPRSRFLRPATCSEEMELVPLADALAQAAGVVSEDEEGGAA
jgi:hypothetical protein